MSVYKEALYICSKLGKQQVQIFDDACDYGIPIESESDSPAMRMVQQLKEMYFDEKNGDKREQVNFSLGSTVTLYMFFLDEWGSGDEVPCVITYTRQPFKRSRYGALKGILSIDCPWAN